MFQNSGEKTSCYEVNIPLFTRFFSTSQVVVWDFFHQQYVSSLKDVNLPSVILGNKIMVVMHDAGFSTFSNPPTHSHFGAIEGEHPWQTWRFCSKFGINETSDLVNFEWEKTLLSYGNVGDGNVNEPWSWMGQDRNIEMRANSGQHPMVPPPLCNVNACCVLGGPGGVGGPGIAYKDESVTST